MYFLAYDMEEFIKDGRGFYEDYESFVPGPVVHTTEELIRTLSVEDTFGSVREQFKNRYYRYLDGRSTDRLLDILL
jgi:CDP-ribitol ribitolphosphotransferase